MLKNTILFNTFQLFFHSGYIVKASFIWVLFKILLIVLRCLQNVHSICFFLSFMIVECTCWILLNVLWSYSNVTSIFSVWTTTLCAQWFPHLQFQLKFQLYAGCKQKLLKGKLKLRHVEKLPVESVEQVAPLLLHFLYRLSESEVSKVQPWFLKSRFSM